MWSPFLTNAAQQEGKFLILHLKKSLVFPEEKFEREFSNSLLLTILLFMKCFSDRNRKAVGIKSGEYERGRTFHRNSFIFLKHEAAVGEN